MPRVHDPCLTAPSRSIKITCDCPRRAWADVALNAACHEASRVGAAGCRCRVGAHARAGDRRSAAWSRTRRARWTSGALSVRPHRESRTPPPSCGQRAADAAQSARPCGAAARRERGLAWRAQAGRRLSSRATSKRWSPSTSPPPSSAPPSACRRCATCLRRAPPDRRDSPLRGV